MSILCLRDICDVKNDQVRVELNECFRLMGPVTILRTRKSKFIMPLSNLFVVVSDCFRA